MVEDKLLTPEEVAARLDIAPVTVVRWMRAGKLPGRKFGQKVWRVRAADLEAFITQPPVLRLVEAPAAPAPPADLTPQARKAALVSRLRAMQAQGLSHHAIATRLNAEGVPTLTGRGQWQKGTVGNLLAQGPGEP
jgi:excisionase family DNA binding protein